MDSTTHTSAPRRNLEITLNVNGQARRIEVNARETLAEALRFKLKLIGTKLGCNRAECGTCTVIMDGQTVYSCTVLAVEADRRKIETIEGLQDGPTLHPIQRAFIEADALQCGYCIPGMLMSCKNLLDQNSNPSAEDIRRATQGNYCRCGAYPNIIAATLSAAKELREERRTKS